MADLLSRYFWPFRDIDEEDWLSLPQSSKSGLSISEDKDHVYVEADVPGIEPEKIDVTYKKGVLTIKGVKEEKEEDKNKKFYRHAKQDFFYQVMVPGNIDESAEPVSSYKNGTVTIKFPKRLEEEPKKIEVRRS